MAAHAARRVIAVAGEQDREREAVGLGLPVLEFLPVARTAGGRPGVAGLFQQRGEHPRRGLLGARELRALLDSIVEGREPVAKPRIVGNVFAELVSRQTHRPDPAARPQTQVELLELLAFA